VDKLVHRRSQVRAKMGPIYIREGSILVLGKVGEKRVVYDYFEDVQVMVVQPIDGRRARAPVKLVDDKGEAMGEITLNGGELVVPDVVKDGWQLTVNGKDQTASVQSVKKAGGNWTVWTRLWV
jgi:hypothetical protein